MLLESDKFLENGRHKNGHMYNEKHVNKQAEVSDFWVHQHSENDRNH